jgi:hypothetical protein
MASWVVSSLGDFNGDANTDLLLTRSSGAAAILLMN